MTYLPARALSQLMVVVAADAPALECLVHR